MVARWYSLIVFCLFGVPVYFYAQQDVISAEERAKEESVEETIKRKENTAKEMVEKALLLFSKKSVAECCNIFTSDPAWRQGELVIFIFDDRGVCYIHGSQKNVIWEDFYDEKDPSQSHSFIAEMLEKGEKGSLINYNWNNAVHRAYVKVTKKQGKRYIIGCGFYPQSQRFRTQVLVESVVTYIQEHGAKDAFPRIDNTNGIFVKGDIYVVVFDFDGVCVAHGDDVARVGQNMLKWPDDENEKHHIQLIIDAAQGPEGKRWISYKKDGATKIAYVVKVVDPLTNKPYALSAGYYPDVNEEAVRKLVNKGVDYIKRHGREGLEGEFLGKNMRFGSIRLFVYDPEGNAIVDAYDPQFIGQNVMWLKDSDGRPVIKLIIDQALKFDRSWVRYVRRNEYKLSYVEKVATTEGILIVGGGYFPASKEEDARGMVIRGIDLLLRHDKELAFKEFSNPRGDYLHGDIHIEVHDEKGFSWVDSDRRYLIWNNDSSIKDPKGRSIIDVWVATARSGGGWLEVTLHRALNRVYVKSVEKPLPNGDIETFIISSGYYM